MLWAVVHAWSRQSSEVPMPDIPSGPGLTEDADGTVAPEVPEAGDWCQKYMHSRDRGPGQATVRAGRDVERSSPSPELPHRPVVRP